MMAFDELTSQFPPPSLNQLKGLSYPKLKMTFRSLPTTSDEIAVVIFALRSYMFFWPFVRSYSPVSREGGEEQKSASSIEQEEEEEEGMSREEEEEEEEDLVAGMPVKVETEQEEEEEDVEIDDEHYRKDEK